MTSLGTAEADPGELSVGRLTVGENRDGSSVSLPVAIIEGSSEGPTLYIQAASDGDEVNGVGVLQRFVPEIDPTAITGTILIVGVVNTYGFQQATHRNPIDDTKLNRVYPGDADGTTSERIAHETFEIAQEADYVVDLHQGSTSRMIDEVRIRCGPHHRLHGECVELAKVFGAGHIFDQKGPDGQLAREIVDDGIPAIDPELGGSVGLDESSVRIGLQGLNRVLEYYGFRDGTIEPEDHIRAHDFDRYNSPAGGLVTFHADLGDQVERGDVIFEVTDLFGRVKNRVSAASGGVFWRTRRLPQVATGEYVCSIGTDIDDV